jgi:UDP-hydrolysing UDP-N-acetyl-D-glucosamine 2-epimerase
MTHVAVAVGSRATWSSVQSVVEALGERCTVLAYGSALSDRYGGEGIVWPERTVRFTTLLEGEHGAGVQTAALTMSALGHWLEQHRPDWVLVNGDRTEQLGAAYAASLLNLRVAHAMAGEVSGSIDDRVRGAISALADLRLSSTKLAAERCSGIHTGCPRIDMARRALENDLPGLGRCILVAFHPVTTEADCGEQMTVLELAVMTVAVKYGLQVHACWPNVDAGSNAVTTALRHWAIPKHRTMSPEQWTRAMLECRVLVGNSSSGIREGSYIGTPVVNVGSRQRGRERAGNVMDVAPIMEEIVAAIERQLEHGRYACSTLYGDGHAASRIVQVLR